MTRSCASYDLGESEGNHFLVMEEVNGSSFWNRWRNLPLSDRLRICGQVAEALNYAHLQGVIHRDVKPGNVLLTAEDEAKLSDFGLSLVTDEGRDQSGTIRGTPRYMSPEQAQGLTLDHRTDLYSVGVMVYECSTGEVPFVGPAMSVMSQHINATPRAPRLKNPDLSSMLDSLILSLLEKNPSKRPASGSEVAQALGEEAERARRLERLTSGLSRSDAQEHSRPAAVGLDDRGRTESRGGQGERLGPGRAGFARAVGERNASVPLRRSAQIGQDRPPAFDERGVLRPSGRPRDARENHGHAGRHLAGSALPLRPLSGVPPGRVEEAGDLPPKAARREELGPRPA